MGGGAILRPRPDQGGNVKVRMLHTKVASPNGIDIIPYLAGKKYDIPDQLAQMFIDHRWAEEDKDLMQAPETKAAPYTDDADHGDGPPWGGKWEDASSPVSNGKKIKRRK